MELEQTLQQLDLMKKVLEHLHKERHRYSAQWFEILCEGPREEIEKLEKQVKSLELEQLKKLE